MGSRRRHRQGNPLTKDGVKDFGYATDNAGWTRSDRPIVLWSPDSKKIATFQQDQRAVGEMHLVDVALILLERRPIFFESGDHTTIGRSLRVQPALSVA